MTSAVRFAELCRLQKECSGAGEVEAAFAKLADAVDAIGRGIALEERQAEKLGERLCASGDASTTCSEDGSWSSVAPAAETAETEHAALARRLQRLSAAVAACEATATTNDDEPVVAGTVAASTAAVAGIAAAASPLPRRGFVTARILSFNRRTAAAYDQRAAAAKQPSR